MSTLLQKIFAALKLRDLARISDWQPLIQFRPFEQLLTFYIFKWNDLSTFVITSTLKDDALAGLYDNSNVNNEVVRSMSSRSPCIYMYYLYPKWNSASEAWPGGEKRRGSLLTLFHEISGFWYDDMIGSDSWALTSERWILKNIRSGHITLMTCYRHMCNRINASRVMGGIKGTVSRYCACTKLWFLDRMSRNQKMRGE